MLSKSCRYGIRAVIYIASKSNEKEKVRITQISKDLDLPTPFLAKILQQLARHKILSSLKGPHGGFYISRDPRKITLLDIVKIIDGEDVLTDCIIHDGSCRCVDEQKKPCPVHSEYARMRSEIIKLFEENNIYDLAKKTKEEVKDLTL